MLGMQSQIILRISFFSTVERWAGRGFAKLLLTHLKAQAGESFSQQRQNGSSEMAQMAHSLRHSFLLASMARSTGKEVTMVLLSLQHTLKFWTSKSMVRYKRGQGREGLIMQHAFFR